MPAQPEIAQSGNGKLGSDKHSGPLFYSNFHGFDRSNHYPQQLLHNSYYPCHLIYGIKAAANVGRFVFRRYDDRKLHGVVMECSSRYVAENLGKRKRQLLPDSDSHFEFRVLIVQFRHRSPPATGTASIVAKAWHPTVL